MKNILIACEESQRVCEAFRRKGHKAFSCDIQDCSGGHPEWHIKGDVIPLLNGFCKFKTCDGFNHYINNRWDIIIAFPPCTYLTVTGNRWFNIERYGEKAIERIKKRECAIEFFMQFVTADCDKIAIENPVGHMSTCFKKPTQIIQPFYFGEPVRKTTCLWLKGLPPLQPTNIVEPDIIKVNYTNKATSYSGPAWYATDENGKILSWKDPRTAKIRSKTYQGIAEAMAEQWGAVL